MAHLVTILAFDIFGITRLVAFLAHVPFFATVSAIVPATSGTLFGKVAHCKLSALDQKTVVRKETDFRYICDMSHLQQSEAPYIRLKYGQIAWMMLKMQDSVESL